LGANGTEFANAFVDTVTSTEIKTEGVTVNDNLITASRSNDNLQLDATGTGAIEMIPIKIIMANLPTSNPGVAGQLWRDGTDLKISTG
jgi:acetylglutamate kinase